MLEAFAETFETAAFAVAHVDQSQNGFGGEYSARKSHKGTQGHISYGFDDHIPVFGMSRDEFRARCKQPVKEFASRRHGYVTETAVAVEFAFCIRRVVDYRSAVQSRKLFDGNCAFLFVFFGEVVVIRR